MSPKSKAPTKVPTKVEPKRLSVDANSDGLIEITIQLRKRKLVVREASYLDTMTRGMNIGKLLDELPETEEETPLQTRNNLIMNVWCPLISCTTGKGCEVPTQDEFFSVPEVDVAFWIETARELNPTWFAWLDAVEKLTVEALKEATKKKERKPIESSKS